MILSLLFIFFLLLENMILPALVGSSASFIVLLFTLSIVVYGRNLRTSILQATVFMLIAEIFSGVSLGSLLIPFVLTVGVYIGLNRFLNIKSGLEEGGLFITMLGGILVLGSMVYLYSYLFLLLDFTYGFSHDWEELIILFKASVSATVVGAIFFGILFKYALKPK